MIVLRQDPKNIRSNIENINTKSPTVSTSARATTVNKISSITSILRKIITRLGLNDRATPRFQATEDATT